MNRQEKVVLLGLAVLFLAGAFLAGSDNPKASAQMGGVALKRGLVNVTGKATAADGALGYPTWGCPEWSIKSVGADLLNSDHPLYRRPPFIGHNRHKVMSEGWSGWYYNPPGEERL